MKPRSPVLGAFVDGALTLARYIEEQSSADLQVLDLGCGLGLTGIVAD
jgi:16S rRNA G1207 methylase RsmC